jgi:predicted membrane-bound mannosyltransferase
MIPNAETYSELISVIDMGIHHTFILAALMAFILRLSGRAGSRRQPLKLPLTLPGLLTLAGAVRLPLLDEVFWYDETFQHRLSTIPLDDFWPALLSDVHPPGVYLITRLSAMLFGQSEVALRLPAMMAGLLAVYLMYRLAHRLYNRQTALLAAGLLALMPAFIAYSMEWNETLLQASE